MVAKFTRRSVAALIGVLAITACGGSSGTGGFTSTGLRTEVDPANLDPAKFVLDVTHSLFPLTPGTALVYGGDEDILVEVLSEKKGVQGVAATVVRDRVYEDGALVEDTDDWFAQDIEGNVWYLGEEVEDFDPETGEVIADGADAGSFEAGVDGAEPGIQMPGVVQVGDKYKQEFAPGIAEDEAENVEVNASVTVPAGSFTGCLVRRESTPLEPGISELKWFCPGVGMVKEMVETHTDPEEIGKTVELEQILTGPVDPAELFADDGGADEDG